jgi:carbon monoxide dehydrogenase subunit G
VDLQHRFTVPTGVEQTWAHFEDLAALAECFPGATLTSADATSFAGSVKVKLGPIALVYNGSGTFVDKNEETHSFKVDAKGKDKRGNGTAGAKVSLSMAETADGSTEVEVITDLAITGKPAQFGRGVMQDVSDKLLGQFVACLEDRLTAGPDGSAVAGVADEVGPEPTPIADAAAASTGTASAPAAPAAPRPPAPRPAVAQDDDALDLGAAVIPVLLRGYWKQGLAGLAVVALVVRWVRRR